MPLRSDSVLLFVSDLAARIASPRKNGWRVRDAFTPNATPHDLYALYYGAVTAYVILVPILGLVSIGVAIALASFLGSRGNHIAADAGVFVAAFCLIGGLDAYWRTKVLAPAMKRFDESGVDDFVRRRMRIARLDDGTVVFQVLGAALLCWAFAAAG
jgi:hypothetical protein